MLGILLQNVTIVTKSFDSITKCVGTKEDLIEQLIFDKCYKRSWAPSTGTLDLSRYRNIRSHKATVFGTELFISANCCFQVTSSILRYHTFKSVVFLELPRIQSDHREHILIFAKFCCGRWLKIGNNNNNIFWKKYYKFSKTHFP